MQPEKKIALVTDWITDKGGAEKVFEKLVQMYPQADIYTSVFWQQDNPIFQNRSIYTSFLQHIPFLNTRHKLTIYLRPIAFESFDFSEYDIVISCTSAEAKGIITLPTTKHICYCHTPTRYLWSHEENYKKYLEFGLLNPLAKIAMKWVMPRMKQWDKTASLRPDIFIANSQTTQERIKIYYDRESTIIHPFFSSKKESRNPNLATRNPAEYYFAIGRSVPYKRFDLLVDTFNNNKKQLIIATATDNKLFRELKNKSKENITWILGASDEEIGDLFKHAQAYLMPQEEDFGITPVESMSHGTPVIAYAKGGATESVIPDKTGVFFDRQNQETLDQAILEFESKKFDPEACKKHAENFSEERFERKIQEVLGF